jgi:hypothetical protein
MRTAPTDKVLNFFRHFLKELTTQKMLNVVARSLDSIDGEEVKVDDTLHAAFIGKTLAEHYILEVADNHNMSELSQQAAMAIKDYKRASCSGYWSFIKLC